MRGAIVYRAPRPTLAVAEQRRFWQLPWITDHVHEWLVLGSYALCATCSSAVAVVDSRDEEGGQDAE